ncbi:ABC transporter ATP-binding protein [Lacibacterium aquatile]|uniref:ABC transporter ATP-binding protein n=1 Tax=Lacibacterium aquatile TaxID=1168082 RepID=A0ABW5DTQ7_9PROT
MIEVKRLSLALSGNPILDGYDFTLPKGAVLAILGANGIGKTSLISCIAGLKRPDAGSAKCGGQIGFVPQLVDVAFDYSVIDMVLMGRARHMGLFGSPKAADFRIAHEMMELLSIRHLAERSFNALSGGQRQLATIAQALASECEVLILDEPCSALDYRNQAIVIETLARLRRDHGMTIVFTSHTPQHALEIATHVLLMHSGTSFDFGPMADVLTEDNLSRLYGVPVRQAHFEGSGAYTFAPLLTSL